MVNQFEKISEQKTQDADGIFEQLDSGNGRDGHGNGLTPSGRSDQNPKHAEKLVDEL